MTEAGEIPTLARNLHTDGQVLHVRPNRPIQNSSIPEEHLLERIETVGDTAGPADTLLEVPQGNDAQTNPPHCVSDVPYDQGYAWVVVFGCFLMHVLNVGLIKSFGIIFVELKQFFGASNYELSWIYALFLLFSTWFAPFASVLANAFSQRSTVILGGFFLGLGISLSYFAHNLFYLYFAYGCLSGFGSALSYTPSVVCVGSYFEKRRGLANGLSLSGAAVGSIAMPYLVTFMIDKYGIFGAILLCGGVAFNVCLAGALMRPISVHQQILHAQERSAQVRALGFISSTMNEPPSPMAKAFSAPASARSNGGVSSGFERDEMYSNLLDTPSQEERKRSAQSMPDDSFRSIQQSAPTKPSVKKAPFFERIRNRFRRKEGQPPLFDFRLFKTRLFLVYASSVMLSTFAFMNVFLILPQHTKDLGYSNETGASLIAVIGIADFFARIGFGWFSDLKLFHRKWGFCGAIYCASLCNFLLPLATSYFGLTIYSIFFGMTSGSYISLVAVVCVDFFGIQRLSSALGSVIAFQGVAFLVGPPLIGQIKDVTGSYQLGFFTLGICLIIAASLIVLEHFLDVLILRFRLRKRKDDLDDQYEVNELQVAPMVTPALPELGPRTIPPIAHLDEFDKLTPRPGQKPVFQPKFKRRKEQEQLNINSVESTH